jgi:hypothetical protein
MGEYLLDPPDYEKESFPKLRMSLLLLIDAKGQLFYRFLFTITSLTLYFSSALGQHIYIQIVTVVTWAIEYILWIMTYQSNQPKIKYTFTEVYKNCAKLRI